ncbi:hypothetical protein DXM27_24950 [Rhizobium rhizogenes]|uniref:Uncharacterized protein n=1 Tax=Rhizobium rhizogenes TaxID=359 RepID=A0AA88JQ25_RHIRH|nr:hypothetical protein DXM27_24950 [Rhizobium rhizogenes]KAA3521799.1 hypothetical protein DXM29_24060 [Agrobacterium tumefaciens]
MRSTERVVEHGKAVGTAGFAQEPLGFLDFGKDSDSVAKLLKSGGNETRGIRFAGSWPSRQQQHFPLGKCLLPNHLDAALNVVLRRERAIRRLIKHFLDLRQDIFGLALCVLDDHSEPMDRVPRSISRHVMRANEEILAHRCHCHFIQAFDQRNTSHCLDYCFRRECRCHRRPMSVALLRQLAWLSFARRLGVGFEECLGISLVERLAALFFFPAKIFDQDRCCIVTPTRQDQHNKTCFVCEQPIQQRVTGSFVARVTKVFCELLEAELPASALNLYFNNSAVTVNFAVFTAIRLYQQFPALPT